MNELWAQLTARRDQVAAHPFFGWIRDEAVPLEQRLVFAPVMIDFIMGFADMNKWFMPYPSPRDAHERAINAHCEEDRTHSRLFQENWYELELGAPAGWGAGKMLWWLFQAQEARAVRAFGMDVLRLCCEHEDPRVRFAMIEAIELCGDVFFAHTAPIAGALSARDGSQQRYFGEYHRARETGHLQGADETVFFATPYGAEQAAQAAHVVDVVFDGFLRVLDEVLAYARRALADPARLADAIDRAYKQALHAAESFGGEEPGEPAERAPHESQRPLLRQLDQRLAVLGRHALLDWLREGNALPPHRKLRCFVAAWGIDIVGYKDFQELVLRYPTPADALERALNERCEDLASHGALYLRDWDELDLDEVLRWDAGETLSFYFLGEHTELHRRNMAKLKKLAFRAREPRVRWWLLHALERAGEPLFEATAPIAARAERERGMRLDYWCQRHQLAHHARSHREQVDFLALPLTDEQVADVRVAIDTVFDNMEEQFSASLDAARRQVFVRAPESLVPGRPGHSSAGSVSDERAAG